MAVAVAVAVAVVVAVVVAVMIVAVMIVAVMIVAVMVVAVMVVRVLVARIERVDAPAVPLVVVLVVDVAVPVGPGLGLERLLDRMHMPAQALDHRLQHVIRQQPQPAIAELQRDVPVAHVVGDACQAARIVSMHLDQLLAGGLDRDHPTVGQPQPVTVPQQRAGRQVDADLLAREQRRAQARTLALAEVQLDHLVDPLLRTGRLASHHDRHVAPLQNRK